MAKGGPNRSGAKGRKIGRWERKPSNKLYKAQGRWISNRARRLRKHMARHPNDEVAKAAVDRSLLARGQERERA